MNWVAIASVIATLIGGAGVAGVLKVWLDHKRGKRKQTDDVSLAWAAKFEQRAEQAEDRIAKLEDQQAIERQRCDDELRIVRHRIQGWKQLFYSLLHLFDMPQRQRKDTLEAVRKQMAALEQAEAAETGAMLGARHQEPAE